jgi:hypothetical protein
MMINRLLQLFGKEEKPEHPTGSESSLSQIEGEQSDLLEKTGLQGPRGLWTAILVSAVVAGGLGSLAGRLSSPDACEVNRPALLITKDGQQWTGILNSLDRAGAFFQKENESVRYDFENISRIIFFRDEAELRNATSDVMSTAVAPGYFPGQYDIEAGGHKGELSIFLSQNGSIGAIVRFTNWGTRQPEYLTGVRVTGNRIDFRRACTGTECRRIGSPHDFHQDYTGTLDPVAREIRGNYSGSHSSGTWVARRR